MDKYEALYSFWSRFNIPAYEENSVPDESEVSFPYITYQAVSSSFDEDAVVNSSIWTRSTSWLTADTIANSIEEYLKNGGVTVPYNNGVIWITPGVPFAQSMGDPDDDRIKRKVLSVTLHFS